jgi:hypothetical protein
MSEISREDFMCYVNSVNSWSEKLCNRYLSDVPQNKNTKCSLMTALIKVRRSNPPFKQIIYESIYDGLYIPLMKNQKVSRETLVKSWF